jgi:hypothetical protein
MNGVKFKIDLKKAYDKVKWSFLQESHAHEMFPTTLARVNR